ncbi:PQQ-dependent sugar dehydrogenase [Rubrivirga sp. IMCC45206]|uniref:PQQ-dependent sugar dehydrogenase n=1 Tax=Rubrivirga sp. IMCC45206 TaxID=3391614 RepID=UPI00399034FE
MLRPVALGLVVAALAASGCGDTATLTVADGTGPNPALPEPTTSLLPTVNIADAEAWPEGTMPTPAAGLTVARYADGFDHPRWLHVLPNGDVLVAESNAPPEAGTKGLIGRVRAYFFKKAGAGVPSADRITLVRDADGDGVAETRTAFLTGLASPFGMALVGDSLYVANSASVVRFPYTEGATQITAAPDTVALLPAGTYNQHWTRNLIASPDGQTLYVAIGSASNVGEHGLEEEVGRAAIWAIDLATGDTEIYASGLRNPVGMAFEPTTGALWTAVNERDELGSDLVPDYMTSVRPGAFYGWPYSYWGGVVDTRVEPRPDLVATAIAPDYALGPHTASLGLAWVEAGVVGDRAGMVIGQHGSWNRKPRSGYRVVFVPFADGRPDGMPVDVLTGFLSHDEETAYGRPVGVAVAGDGALLVADDVGNVVWRVMRR